MGPIETGIAGMVIMFVMIALRVPIALAMALVGAGGTVVLSGETILLRQLQTLAFDQFSLYDLSVVPFFILMGQFAGRSGLSGDLFAGVNAWIGRLRGGVAMAAIGACAGFGAVCGSSLATASTMGQVALPELRRLGYAPALATGTLAAGGTLGILIPPSVVLVIYAVTVESNIVTMFGAALVPGLIAVVFFLAVIRIQVLLKPELGPAATPVPWPEKLRLTLRLAPVVLVFGVVIGGIYMGLFNPTPAAAVGALLVGLYGIGLRLAGRGGLGPAGLKAAMLETALSTAMIYLILFGAALLQIFLARSGLPQAGAALVRESTLDPYLILVAILVLLILLGCLMDSLSMILLAIPFLWPVVAGLDFGLTPEDQKVWFGIIALVVVELGLITPPVGLNVFIINGLAHDVPMRETFRGVMPFFAAEILRVALLVAVPAITLTLPRLLGY
ncbi:MAG: C4-dicarboxylate ABC transporter permease [Tistrella sp.]|uniref:TRAP transporter large permease n=1 Tax=Tistrella sp. TaxID=2024861 RepID=UPI000C355CF0|nr:TRAP transporter large permease [Tistrella sp.]MAD40236.1 C4-dicarboxylate ABC transporter permease [Tistrella sp.]MBA79379.1 C4-dicarboxylate ABC transporter permease [Tistrella sp.]